MTYLRTELSVSRSSGSLIIVIRPNSKDNFRTAAMLFFHILQKKLQQGVISFEDLLLYKSHLWSSDQSFWLHN
jgi:hypothetical protein